MRICHHIVLIFVTVIIAGAVSSESTAQEDLNRSGLNTSGQSRNGQNLVREWIRLQRIALDQVQSFSVSETVNSTMDAGTGQRNYRLVTRQTAERLPEGDPSDGTPRMGRFQIERDILELVANGQEISTDRAYRFLMQQRRVLRPELVGMLESFHFPVQEAARWESVESLQMIERGGTHFWRLDGVIAMRPPFGRPPERRARPNEEDRPPPPRQRPAHKSRITAWFTTDTFRLHATVIEFPLPGRFSLSLQTTFLSEGQIDIPQRRVVEGTIPIRRRSRMFAVQFKHTTRYSDFEITRN